MYFMDKTFAGRLVNARRIRCISQRELCSRLQGLVSPAAVEKYEKGQMMPSSSVLILMSEVLGMPLDYFFRPFTVDIDPSKFEFRKKSSMGKKKIESVKYSVCAEIEKYIEIESILGINTQFSMDFSNVIVECEDDAMQLARRLRQNLNIGFGAIVSAIELLESCGVKIIEIEHDDKFSGTCISVGEISVIVINKSMSSERKRMTIFHELGHLLMRFADGVDEEKMCTVFANEVLIPSNKFKDMLGASRHDISLVELQAIQSEYGVSVDALMKKAEQLNVITSSRYSAFHKKKNAVPSFKNAVEKSHYPMERTNRFERLVYRALASEVISCSKAASLLEISVGDVRNNLNLM
jgi:Zn-dependent peptidase ImmA (M78 family)